MQKNINGVQYSARYKGQVVTISRRGRQGGGNRDVDIPVEFLAMVLREDDYCLTKAKARSLLTLVGKAQDKYRLDAERLDPAKACQFMACLWSLAVKVEGEIALIPNNDINYLRTIRAECEAMMAQFYKESTRLSAILSHRGLNKMLPSLSFDEGDLSFDLSLLERDNNETE